MWIPLLVMLVGGLWAVSSSPGPFAAPSSGRRSESPSGATGGVRERPTGAQAQSGGSGPSEAQGVAALRAAGWRDAGVQVAREAARDGMSWATIVSRMGVYPPPRLPVNCAGQAATGAAAASALAFIPGIGPVLAAAAAAEVARAKAECEARNAERLAEDRAQRDDEAELAESRIGGGA